MWRHGVALSAWKKMGMEHVGQDCAHTDHRRAEEDTRGGRGDW